MARAASLVVAACAVLITACTAAHAPPATGAGTPAQPNGSTVQAGRPASPPPVRGAAYTSGGCGATPPVLGSAPRWASSSDPPPIRYALAEEGQVAGFLFGYPLMAGNPRPYSDKILWVVASPGMGCRCGLPVIRFMPPGPLCHRPGRRIRRRGRSVSIPPKSPSPRQAAGSSPCRGTGTRTPLTSGMSGTGSNREASAWTRPPARATGGGQTAGLMTAQFGLQPSAPPLTWLASSQMGYSVKRVNRR